MKSKIWIFCLTLLLLALLAWFSFAQEAQIPHFSVRLTVDGTEEVIHCQSASDGRYYVFLPSYAKLSQAYIRMEGAEEISINGQALRDGLCCDVFAENVVYDFQSGGERGEFVFSLASGVPSMHIDTRSGSMDYIHAKKDNEETASLRLYTSEGNRDYSGSEISIQGRGNYTWTDYDKKPYNLTLASDANLLGMGAAQRWILLANAADASNIRNKLVYDFASAIGLSFSPHSTWIELYLNGKYAGLYLLCERNEIHPQRVSLADDGSFLVSAEFESRLKNQNYPYFATPSGQTFRLQGPKDATQEEKQQYDSILTSVENAIFSPDGTDPRTGRTLWELIDLDSWTKKYLAEEVFCNVDACLISQFYYYDANRDCVFAGPIWDFDMSLGNDTHWATASPYVFAANQLRSSETSSTAWFVQLYQNPIFYQALVETYEKEFVPRIRELIDSGIDAYAEQIELASVRNALRWGTDRQAREEVMRIKTFLTERTNFLSEAWENNTEYCIIQLCQGSNVYYPIPRGQLPRALPTLPDTEKDLFMGWYYVGTDEPFDVSKPITEDISLYAKWKENPQDRIKDILKLVPLAVMAVVFLAMLVIEGKKVKNGKGR